MERRSTTEQVWPVESEVKRGIVFYNVPLSDIKEGLKFNCELEPFNARDENSIVLKCSPTATLGTENFYREIFTYATQAIRDIVEGLGLGNRWNKIRVQGFFAIS